MKKSRRKAGNGKSYKVQTVTIHDSHYILTDANGRRLLHFEQANVEERKIIVDALNGIKS